MAQEGHEQVCFCYDRASGLKAIIAIHDTTLGPAMGGCRMWPYSTEETAVEDALRLAKGMTYKTAAAGLNLGGGKAVIWGDPVAGKSEALLLAFGRFVATLGGRFITGTDVGTDQSDFALARQETPWVVTLPEEEGGSGDSAVTTAYGVMRGMQAAARFRWGSDSLSGRRVAVQGLGKVGRRLVAHLSETGAAITVTDLSPERVREVCEQFRGIRPVAPEEIYAMDCDIFAPCALGGVLNDETIPQLRCAIVAGSANNQLQEPHHGAELHRRSILWAPDYVINAGGVIQAAGEAGGFSREWVLRKTEAIYDTLLRIFALSRREGLPTTCAADRLAEQRIGHYFTPTHRSQGGTFMGIFEQMKQYEHEQVVFCYDRASELKAIIAIHDTTLGPALGGVRMWPYDTEEDALTDALRLSRGMTYKNAAMGLNFGGGKAVILGDPKTEKSEELFRAFGKFVQSLGGRYVTAEDVGTTVEDLNYVLMETEHAVGRSNVSGDPSPVTAFGVYRGIKASARWAFGSEDLAGKRVAVQGLGKVGYSLCRHLHDEGARLVVSDLNEAAVQRAVKEFGASPAGVAEIYDAEVDIFSPCGLGGVLNDETIPRLKCRVVAGAANNQLKEPRHGDVLRARGILYAPDFVINGGGVLNVAEEFARGGYDRDRALARVGGIYDKLLKVYQIADARQMSTARAADLLAEERIQKIHQLHRMYVAE